MYTTHTDAARWRTPEPEDDEDDTSWLDETDDDEDDDDETDFADDDEDA